MLGGRRQLQHRKRKGQPSTDRDRPKRARQFVTDAPTYRLMEDKSKKLDVDDQQILSLYERSKNPDFRQRPKYREVLEAMDAVNKPNSNTFVGTMELAREQKRHVDWIKQGKRLFGKVGQPLKFLHEHMKRVEEKNRACFDLTDQPRMPVEPSSREHTPDDFQDTEGFASIQTIFCICRKPEAGMMIECGLCNEWYHYTCLKIARGKVKQEDKYNCPICDHRVKIPRDATRPKLEDLQAWQEEVHALPFQPEEEDTLEAIISHGVKFRDWVSKYINPLLSSPDELNIERFCLRKLEGADILLANEINFFRQELHKWAPVAPQPPPILEASPSTRKSWPTEYLQSHTSPLFSSECYDQLCTNTFNERSDAFSAVGQFGNTKAHGSGPFGLDLESEWSNSVHVDLTVTGSDSPSVNPENGTYLDGQYEDGFGTICNKLLSCEFAFENSARISLGNHTQVPLEWASPEASSVGVFPMLSPCHTSASHDVAITEYEVNRSRLPKQLHSQPTSLSSTGFQDSQDQARRANRLAHNRIPSAKFRENQEIELEAIKKRLANAEIEIAKLKKIVAVFSKESY